jgi:hypothetical protein
MFINSKSPWDWTSIDSSGASRIDAWANGGANDICPAGFSVPTEAELAADTIISMLVQSQGDLLLINMLVAGVMVVANIALLPEVLDS